MQHEEELRMAKALKLLALVNKRHDLLFAHSPETMQLVLDISEFVRDHPDLEVGPDDE